MVSRWCCACCRRGFRLSSVSDWSRLMIICGDVDTIPITQWQGVTLIVQVHVEVLS